jgi:NADPH-dependent 2,4-dienoyl-CoA reductase/sulfur reductase-like enzyme
MAAALSIAGSGKACVLVDRERYMGGILLQCIHNGFGLRLFGEELTGPEFASRLESRIFASDIPFFGETTVLSIERENDTKVDEASDVTRASGGFRIVISSVHGGVRMIRAGAVVLAMGSRERNRGNVRIAGDRPAGVFTAGLAQRLINIDGYIPGKRAVIIGSGDIGLIMARRLALSGAKVEAVLEILPYPSGLARNVAQCLDDFSIPLLLSHAAVRIIGKDRVTGVETAPIENGAVLNEKARVIPCDTVLLSVGLVCENELSAKSGVAINPVTNGPIVDPALMTCVPGIFAAGNVLHIHDLADRAAEEGTRAGLACAAWLDESDAGKTIASAPAPALVPLTVAQNVRYTVPSFLGSAACPLLLRSMTLIDHASLVLEQAGRRIFVKRFSWVRPGEMLEADLPSGCADPSLGAVTVALVPDGEERNG